MKSDVKFSSTSSFVMLSPRKEFQGKGAVFLGETGLLADGNLPRFTIPLIGWFYSALFCARTTRTIPYSRITSYRYSGDWISFGWLKVFFLILLISAAIAATAGTLQTSTDPMVYLVFLWSLVTLIASLMFLTGVRIHTISYILPDNTRQTVAFKLRGATRLQIAEFSKQVRNYMTTVQSFGSGKLTKNKGEKA